MPVCSLSAEEALCGSRATLPCISTWEVGEAGEAQGMPSKNMLLQFMVWISNVPKYKYHHITDELSPYGFEMGRTCGPWYSFVGTHQYLHTSIKAWHTV